MFVLAVGLVFLKNSKYFFFKISFFYIFESFWCVNVKNNFFNNFLKKIIFDAFPSKNHF
jgi:hypothetical protein